MTKLLGFLMASAACAATSVYAQTVQPVPGAGDAASTLSMHLRTLAASPRDLFALLGAGQAALDVGDPNAALGFFARAEELAPNNGRAKAGLASALVQLEKPDDALPLFGQAVSLGVAESEIAADRGLAYDLRGDSKRAQKDYALALKRGPDDEVTRRYALSLAISGDRDGAIQLLDPLLRKQDRAAWRARSFILALTGDLAGANGVARQVMPAPLAASISPFLTRLGKLNPAEQAHAVNFGTMPSDGQTFASVQIGDPFKPVVTPRADVSAGSGLIPAGEPLGRKPAGTQIASAAPVAPKPPLATEPVRVDRRVGVRIAPVDPTKLPPEARGEGVTKVELSKATQLPPPDIVRLPAPALPPAPPPASTPTPTPALLPGQIAADPKPFEIGPTPVPPTAAPTPTPTPTPVPAQVAVASPSPVPTPSPGLIGPPVDPEATPGFSSAVPAAAPPAPQLVDLPASTAAETRIETAAATIPGSRLASILAGIEPEAESAPVALPSAAEIRAAQRAVAKKSADAAAAAVADNEAKDAKVKQAALDKANPARLWVQVATGANERSLAATWKKIRDANGKALKGLGGYSVPFRATNRVLAGPVKSQAEARALISALAKNGVTATSYGSEKGQEVVRLAAK
jgi:tetratricopeptide (TPR) repeat protein